MMENSFLSLLPPIIAILLAILSKRVLLSLLAGVFLGSVIINGLSVTALFQSFDDFVVPTLSNNDNVKVLLFTMFLGGVVSVIVNTGFAQMLINSITKHNQTKTKHKHTQTTKPNQPINQADSQRNTRCTTFGIFWETEKTTEPVATGSKVSAEAMAASPTARQNRLRIDETIWNSEDFI